MIQEVVAFRTGLTNGAVTGEVWDTTVGAFEFIAHETSPAVSGRVIDSDAVSRDGDARRVDKPESFFAALAVG